MTAVAAVAITVASGGAALPVVASIAASAGISAGLGAIGAAINGGDVFEAATDGLIDGFMWGGVFAATGATINAVKTGGTLFKTGGETLRTTSFSQSGACFVEGTLVITENGIKAIEDIQIGDFVLSFNEKTGEQEYNEVVRLFRHNRNEICKIKTNQDAVISATPEHPFYVVGEGWIVAKYLRAGDKLLLSNGSYVIVEFIQHEILEKPIIVYNFEVVNCHNYYVAEQGTINLSCFVLVHNSCSAFNPQMNAVHAAQYKAPGGIRVTAYQQPNGLFYAKDVVGHGGSSYKVLQSVKGNKYLKLIGDADISGAFIINKHSSKANILFEVVKWLF